ncbi:MAG: small basic protein, partial [Phycisphaerae bacterium]
MSMDKSLKSRGELARHRNVLTRAERVDRLKEEERSAEGHEVFGLPKVAHRKVVTKKHKPAAKPAAEGLALE